MCGGGALARLKLLEISIISKFNLGLDDIVILYGYLFCDSYTLDGFYIMFGTTVQNRKFRSIYLN